MTTENSPIDSFSALFREGTRLLHMGRAKKAVPLLEKAVRLDATHSDAVLNLSGAYILTKKFSKAVPLLEELLEADPENAMAWTNLGAAYLGNPVLARDVHQRKAIGAFKQALAHDPEAPSVAYNIGLIYRDRNENRRALAWFERAVQTDPDDMDAHRYIRRLKASGDKDPSNSEGSLI